MGVTLKDWYDKDQVYDHDTFWVRDENGELTQFSKGTGKPTLQDKTVTENGTYTADDGYDGLGSVTVEVTGSGGSGSDVQGAPFLKMVGSIITNTNKANVDTVHTLYIPKGATIIRAWVGEVYNISKTYYTYISSVSSVSLDDLTIDISPTYCDKVSYTHHPGIGNFSSYNTLEFRVLVSTDAITVKDAGNGLLAGTVNYGGEYFYYSQGDRGVEQIMYLKSLDFADGVAEAPKYVCYNQIFLEDVDLSNIETIGDNAFYGCKSLKSISLSPNLKSLGSSAFCGCKSLSGELIIPDAITELPMNAFVGTKFDRVVFPAGFTKVGSQAFNTCTHPTEFDFSACTEVPTLYLGAYALGEVGNGQVLKIPSALFDSWSTAQYWSDWAAQMVAV